MKNFTRAATLLLCASSIVAQDDAPKTLPELIEYAKKNLSAFGNTMPQDST